MIGTAYIVSGCTDGTVAISSVTVEYTVTDDKKTEIQSVQVKTELHWFNATSSIVTLIKARSTQTNQIKIAISKGLTAQFICLDIQEDGSLLEKSDWTCIDLENSALGLAGGSWINEDEFKYYTVEGEGFQVRMDKDGVVNGDEQEYNKLNAKLVQKYNQQWMEEQMKVTDEDILMNASDALPYLWGAADGINHIFTAIYFR